LAEPIRVALCDDHTVVRSGLRRLLEDETDIAVVGEAGNAEDAVALARAEQPDVLIMDLGLPGVSGIEATRQVHAAVPSTRVLVLTAHDDIAYLRKAFAAGACGYLVKDIVDLELVLAIRQVAAGHEYVHPRLGAALVSGTGTSHRPAGPGGELSEREVRVLCLVAGGYTNAEIAAQLYVSVRTVETHRAHVQQKLGLHSRAELVRYAQDSGVLDDEDTAP
jgi:DNA-binding NarL/FixJ family response regulator